MASALMGMTLTKERQVQTIDVSWKQGSFLGLGGNRSQRYTVFEYKSPNGAPIPVYIQSGYSAPDRLTVNNSLQYGMSDGVFFIVYHDKSQTPYQHRFTTNFYQKAAYLANTALKTTTVGLVDLSWAVGDYLHNFQY